MSKKKSRRGHQKSTANSSVIVNRRARFDYKLGEEIVVGLVLSGKETKAARLGRVQLRGAYVTLNENRATKKNELWLINAAFSLANNAPRVSSQQKNSPTVDTRPRKILAKRREIDRLEAAKNSGFTIIPTKMLNRGKFVKLIIALGKGQKRFDKRETIKKRDLEREQQREKF